MIGAAGPLGGQNINSVGSFLAGWNAVEDMYDKAEVRKRQQEAWKIKQQELENQLQIQNRLKDIAMPDQTQQQINHLSQIVVNQNQQIQAQQQEFKKSNGEKFKGVLNQYLGSLQPNDELPVVKNFLKEHPDVLKSLGVQNPDTLRVYNPMSKEDRAQVGKMASKMNPAFSTYTPEAQNAYIDRLMTTGLVVQIDGKLVDLVALAKTTGSLATADAKTRDIYDGKATSVMNAESMTNKLGTATTPSPKTGAPATGTNELNVVDDIVNNRYGNRKATKKLVLHQTAGSSYEGARAAYDQNKTAPHFTIKKDGTIIRNLPEEAIGAHAKGNNADSIGIEVVGAYNQDSKEWEKMTDQQKQAVAKLTDYLSQKYGFDASNIYAHPEINAKTPGEAAEVKEFVLQHLQEKGATPQQMQIASKAMDEAESRGEDVRQVASTFTPELEQQLYGRIGPSERYSLLKQMGGYSDTRPALQKELQFINDEYFGGQGSPEQVQATYEQLHEAGRSYRPNTYEIMRDDISKVIEMEYGPDWKNNPQARDKYTQMREDLLTRRAGGGAGQIRENQDMQAIHQGAKLYDEYKRTPTNSEGEETLIRQASLLDRDAGLTKEKGYKDNQKALSDGMLTFEHIHRVNQRIDSLNDDEIMRGVVKGPIKMASEYIPEVGEIFDPEVAQHLISNLALDTDLGLLLANYIKSISGLAVTDAERKMLTDIIGLSNIKDPKVMRAKLKQFEDVMGHSIQSRVKDSFTNNYYGLGMRYDSAYKKIKGMKPGDRKPVGQPAINQEAQSQAVQVKSKKDLEKIPVGGIVSYKGETWKRVGPGMSKEDWEEIK